MIWFSLACLAIALGLLGDVLIRGRDSFDARMTSQVQGIELAPLDGLFLAFHRATSAILVLAYWA